MFQTMISWFRTLAVKPALDISSKDSASFPSPFPRTHKEPPAERHADIRSDDLVPELELLLVQLKSNAKTKIENQNQWGQVGHVEGAAAVLLSMVLTLLPQFSSSRK